MGEMVEWFKAPVLKTGEPATVPWVRIPLSPLSRTPDSRIPRIRGLSRHGSIHRLRSAGGMMRPPWQKPSRATTVFVVRRTEPSTHQCFLVRHPDEPHGGKGRDDEDTSDPVVDEQGLSAGGNPDRRIHGVTHPGIDPVRHQCMLVADFEPRRPVAPQIGVTAPEQPEKTADISRTAAPTAVTSAGTLRIIERCLVVVIVVLMLPTLPSYVGVSRDCPDSPSRGPF